MTNIFKGLTEKEKRKLLYNLEAETIMFNKNDSILKYISQANWIGIIESGSAQIIRTDYEGNEIIIDDMKKDSVFGVKFSLLNNDEYDVVAKEESTIILIDYDYIIDMSDKSIVFQKFLSNFLEIVTQMVYTQNERIDILTRKTTREKLLEYFNKESKKTFSKSFELPFTLKELSEYLSIDRAAMMREIKHLKEDRIITSSGKKITLLI